MTMDLQLRKEDSKMAITKWKWNHCSRTLTPNESKCRRQNIKVNNTTSAAHNGHNILATLMRRIKTSISIRNRLDVYKYILLRFLGILPSIDTAIP